MFRYFIRPASPPAHHWPSIRRRGSSGWCCSHELDLPELDCTWPARPRRPDCRGLPAMPPRARLGGPIVCAEHSRLPSWRTRSGRNRSSTCEFAGHLGYLPAAYQDRSWPMVTLLFKGTHHSARLAKDPHGPWQRAIRSGGQCDSFAAPELTANSCHNLAIDLNLDDWTVYVGDVKEIGLGPRSTGSDKHYQKDDLNRRPPPRLDVKAQPDDTPWQSKSAKPRLTTDGRIVPIGRSRI